MRFWIQTLTLVTFALVHVMKAQAASLAEPITPASNGQLQCYSPDTARKTCMFLAWYQSAANGTIGAHALVLISEYPVITMEGASPVEIKAGAVCGKIRKQDIAAAKFTVGGQLLDAKLTAPLQQQALLSFRNILDREICVTYLPNGEMLLAKATIDGVPMPQATDQPMLWVSPNEGYSVSP